MKRTSRVNPNLHIVLRFRRYANNVFYSFSPGALDVTCHSNLLLVLPKAP